MSADMPGHLEHSAFVVFGANRDSGLNHRFTLWNQPAREEIEAAVNPRLRDPFYETLVLRGDPDGHRSFKVQRRHAGLRAEQTRLPWRISRCEKVVHSAGGRMRARSASIFTGS